MMKWFCKKAVVKKAKDQRGYTMVELLVVMLLLCLFGITVVTVIQGGTQAYQSILDNRNAESDARIALSCIGVRVRQNDRAGAVSVQTCTVSGQNALVIKEKIGQNFYYTWFYYHEGALWECALVDEGADPVHANSELIAYLDDYSVNMDETLGAVVQDASYLTRRNGVDEEKTMSSVIALRSGE